MRILKYEKKRRCVRAIRERDVTNYLITKAYGLQFSNMIKSEKLLIRLSTMFLFINVEIRYRGYKKKLYEWFENPLGRFRERKCAYTSCKIKQSKLNLITNGFAY